jgi:hypothetical protein
MERAYLRLGKSHLHENFFAADFKANPQELTHIFVFEQ